MIEHTFGQWKSAFRCIDTTGGSIMLSPTKAAGMIVATAVLHNMRKADHLDDIEPVVAAGDDDAQLLNNAVIGNGGRVRQAIIDRFFNA